MGFFLDDLLVVIGGCLDGGFRFFLNCLLTNCGAIVVVFHGSELGKIGTFEELAEKDAWIMSRQLTAKAFLPCQDATLSPAYVSRETLKKVFYKGKIPRFCEGLLVFQFSIVFCLVSDDPSS